MARQRKNLRQGHHNHHHSNESSEPGQIRHSHSDTHEYADPQSTYFKHLHAHEKRKKVSMTRKFLTVAAMAFTCGVLSLIGLLTYNGYLQTRVNTPFDKHKVGFLMQGKPYSFA